MLNDPVRVTATTAPPPGTCRWCGMIHGPRCYAVAAIEYHPDGTVKRVEFVPPQPVQSVNTDWKFGGLPNS